VRLNINNFFKILGGWSDVTDCWSTERLEYSPYNDYMTYYYLNGRGTGVHKGENTLISPQFTVI